MYMYVNRKHVSRAASLLQKHWQINEYVVYMDSGILIPDLPLSKI